LGELLPDLSTVGRSGSFRCKFERDGDVASADAPDPACVKTPATHVRIIPLNLEVSARPPSACVRLAPAAVTQKPD
jgi:hypothetical protein